MWEVWKWQSIEQKVPLPECSSSVLLATHVEHNRGLRWWNEREQHAKKYIQSRHIVCTCAIEALHDRTTIRWCEIVRLCWSQPTLFTDSEGFHAYEISLETQLNSHQWPAGELASDYRPRNDALGKSMRTCRRRQLALVPDLAQVSCVNLRCTTCTDKRLRRVHRCTYNVDMHRLRLLLTQQRTQITDSQFRRVITSNEFIEWHNLAWSTWAWTWNRDVAVLISQPSSKSNHIFSQFGWDSITLLLLQTSDDRITLETNSLQASSENLSANRRMSGRLLLLSRESPHGHEYGEKKRNRFAVSPCRIVWGIRETRASGMRLNRFWFEWWKVSYHSGSLIRVSWRLWGDS